MAEQVVTPHPAKFSEPIVRKLHEQLNLWTPRWDDRPIRVLDPMAGVGTIHRLRVPGIVATTGVEIEPEWAEQHPGTIEADASDMPFERGFFHLIMTSPPYGNRMADQFVSRDGTKRMTYYHFLGRRLHEESAAGLQFGDAYKRKMMDILIECKRVLRDDGVFVLNVSDFIKAGNPVPVVDWYIDTMIDLRFRVIGDQPIGTRRMRYGANHKLRVQSERVIAFEKVAA